MSEKIIIQSDGPVNILAEKTPVQNLVVEGAQPVIINHDSDAANLIINEDADVLIQVDSDNVMINSEAEAKELILIEGFTPPDTGGAVDIATIELELLMVTDTMQRHKVFEYTGVNLTNQKVYTDNALGTLVYDIDYTYTGDELTQVVVTRVSDSFSYTKNFTYNIDGNLISIEYV